MNKKFPTIIDYEFFKAGFQQHHLRTVNARKFSSLTFRKSGKVSIFTTDISFVSMPNTVTFVPSGCQYDTSVSEDGELYILHYWLLDDANNLFDKPMCIAPPVTDTFINLFERALRHMQNAENPCACMADAYRLLSEFYRLCQSNVQAPNAKMIACKTYLDEHIDDPELRIGHLADLYGCSEVYFRAEFRKCYRMSPLEYLKNSRLEQACRLLQTQLYSVTEVATRVGFDSISYFSAEFRRMMGCLPKEYRER